MKNLAIIIALLLVQTTITATANTSDNNAETQVKQVKEQTTEIKQNPSKNDYSDEYLLKYNIDDLEAAPWLHGGKRVY